MAENVVIKKEDNTTKIFLKGNGIRNVISLTGTSQHGEVFNWKILF